MALSMFKIKYTSLYNGKRNKKNWSYMEENNGMGNGENKQFVVILYKQSLTCGSKNQLKKNLILHIFSQKKIFSPYKITINY